MAISRHFRDHATHHFHNRHINNESGDRHETIEFLLGAHIFDPSHVKTLTRAIAMDLIEKLYPLHALDDRDGGDNTIDLLKDG